MEQEEEQVNIFPGILIVSYHTILITWMFDVTFYLSVYNFIANLPDVDSTQNGRKFSHFCYHIHCLHRTINIALHP